MAQGDLSALQQRIIGALQVDGRATWRKIAQVLDEHERTVARQGSELLASKAIAVAALRMRESSVIMRLACTPGTARLACESLAQRADTTFSYMVTGVGDVVAEVICEANALNELLTLQVPSTPGLISCSTYPVLKYFRTIRGWRIGVLTAAEELALHTELTQDDTRQQGVREAAARLTENDELIIQALQRDGRASVEAVARQVRLSESTVSRRIDWLIRNSHLAIRTLVEPEALGLNTEALLWIHTAPHQVEALGAALARRPEVRYAAAVAGDCQLVADITVANPAQLYDFLSDPSWSKSMTHLQSTMVLQARKRGGQLL
ncbi:Lrp/AsnC family transcriptional regulator [Paeniglutamicibacter sp. ORCA_105]|uniref:Lrp/AsnC family transcriptional regulator n=1 Tax=Paeniglutamicibacter sp. ORCA_105 TaxID=3377336 RepID=UPI003895F517